MSQDVLTMREWAQRFREAVRIKYGRTVSAATIARDLQLWSGGRFQVSNEAVRKWLIGRNMPRYSALVALEGFFGSSLLFSRTGDSPPLANSAFREDDFTHAQVFGQTHQEPFSAGEAAEYLEISIPTLRRYVQSGKLVPSCTVGRNQMFSADTLRTFKRSRARRG